MRSNPVLGTELHYDDEVMIQWGFTEVRGRVAEVYGPPALRRVVVALEPELSSYVVAEATTVALPIADVRKVVPLPTPLTADADTDALITQGSHLLDMTSIRGLRREGGRWVPVVRCLGGGPPVSTGCR